MQNLKYKGKVYTFWELLTRQSIEIPIIQRDYAQGREDKEELRGNFLNALYESIVDRKPIKLDFIYGSNESGVFQPLDGQQRLTTLFLIHWYAASVTTNLTGENISILKRFTYETRSSSREFCSSLVSNRIAFDSEIEQVSNAIIDSSWFFLSWKKDPTIDAMLRCIDDIHKRFRGIDNLWQNLVSQDKLISFYHVELKDIGLTDDLYIKMNARGKLLSPFENFKAGFQKYINLQLWDQGKSLLQTFAFKIDTLWTDLFWKHRKGNSIDEAFMRFISVAAMIQQALEKRPDRIATITRIQRFPAQVKAENLSISGFNYLCESLDTYSRIFAQNIDLKLNFPLWQHEPYEDIFSALVFEENLSSPQRGSASYTQKVLFYAQTEYLRKVASFDKELFMDWMRVVRNIVCRGDIEKNGNRPAIIRSPETFDGVVSLINELAEGVNDIYQFLATKDFFKSSFAKEQIEEEKFKAKLIVADKDNKNVIFKTEDTNLLQGRIEFALTCIAVDYLTEPKSFSKNNLNSVYTVISKYLNDEKAINNVFRRALLSTPHPLDGRYAYYEYWWSYWYLVEAPKRCLIEKFRELEYFIYGNYKNRDYYRGYLKNLVRTLFYSDCAHVIRFFKAPVDMPNWKVRLINEPDLLDEYCPSNYIAIPVDDSCCYLLKSVRPRDIDGCEIVT